MSLDFLYLDEPDMIKAGVLDMKKCVQSMDDMFQVMGQKDYIMGSPSENHHGMMLWFPEEKRSEKMPVAGPDRRFMAMPAYVGGRFNVCGNKWYGSNIENQKKGLPRSILTVMLNDAETGAPLALMSANLLSSIRTGAIPGVATKYLQREGASVLGIIGTGVVSRSCILAIKETMKALNFLVIVKHISTTIVQKKNGFSKVPFIFLSKIFQVYFRNFNQLNFGNLLVVERAVKGVVTVSPVPLNAVVDGRLVPPVGSPLDNAVNGVVEVKIFQFLSPVV